MSKFGTRAMAQSLAHEFGPKGVHVSHVIIDGIINTEKTKGFGQDTPDAKIDPQGVSGARSLSFIFYFISFCVPRSDSKLQIADSYWHLHTQPRSAFTHELDIRPFSEKW